jgi:hypothetical protein
VGILPGGDMTYMLGEASVTTDGMSWRYGYLDVPGSDAGVYDSWYYRVDATWE